MGSEDTSKTSSKAPSIPPRLKRGTSVSQETLRDTILPAESKRSRFETPALESASSEADGARALESIPEPVFDDITIRLPGSILTFRQHLATTCYGTKFIEDVQTSSHLRSLLNNLGPLPEVALHIHVSGYATDEHCVPSITFTLPSSAEIQCLASLSSPRFTLIPCDLHFSNDTFKDGRYFHTTSISDVSAPLSDAVLVLRYSASFGRTRRCFAVIVCDFDLSHTGGTPSMLLSNLASRSKTPAQLATQTCIPSKSFRIRKNPSHERVTRAKPNLSLAIPPAQQANLIKTALTASLRTPLGSSGFHTPQDQRIETPTAPPPLKKEISPYVLKNFCGTPTEPITPSLEHSYPATSLLNRLTMGAIAAGTPNITREEPVPLASPMIARPPILRRSSSLCHTPGGYFRL